MRIFITFFLFFLFSCKSKLNLVEVKIESIEESMKLSENRYDLDNDIYRVGRVFKFIAKIIEDEKLLDEYLIDLKVLGTTKPFSDYEPEYNQTVFQMIYKDILGELLTAEKTGLVENSNNLWMHPPRNEYPSFRKLQLNAFPFVLYPLKKEKWTWNLGAGFGEFGNTLISHDYINHGKEIFVVNNEKLECWEITCNSHSKEGVLTSSVFLYNEKLGFVKMVFNTFDNQQYVLELMEYKL